MIGDPSQIITRNFDVLDEEAGLAQRGTFIVDPDGVVQGEKLMQMVLAVMQVH